MVQSVVGTCPHDTRFLGLECEDARRTYRSFLQSEDRRKRRGGKYLFLIKYRRAVWPGPKGCLGGGCSCHAMRTPTESNIDEDSGPLLALCHHIYGKWQEDLIFTSAPAEHARGAMVAIQICSPSVVNGKGQRKMGDGLRWVTGNTVLSVGSPSPVSSSRRDEF